MSSESPAAQVETTTGPDTLEVLQQALDDVWSTRSVPEKTRMYMDLAVGEVGANIVEHADSGRPVRLRMEVSVLPGEVRATLIDDGSPADIDLGTVSLPEEMAERGRGLAIALRVLDELSYRRDAAGNRWTLVCRLS